MVPSYKSLTEAYQVKLSKRSKILGLCLALCLAVGFGWSTFKPHHDASADYLGGGDSYDESDRRLDSDGDGVHDDFDDCPNTLSGKDVDPLGCALDGSDDDDENDGNNESDGNDESDSDDKPADSDGDGVYDYEDLCSSTPRSVIVDVYGCTLDLDKIKCPEGLEPWIVGRKMIGCRIKKDNSQPIWPYNSSGSDILIDTDGDGVDNDEDDCPNTPSGDEVDDKGCTRMDSDGDGIYDDEDKCLNTPQGDEIDSEGCTRADTDGDGVYDDEDDCPNTPSGDIVNRRGCARVDVDGDGVYDDSDLCPNTPQREQVDSYGCTQEQSRDRCPEGVEPWIRNGKIIGCRRKDPTSPTFPWLKPYVTSGSGS